MKNKWIKIGEQGYPDIGIAYDIKLKNGTEINNTVYDEDDDSSFFEKDYECTSVNDVTHFKRDY